RHREVYVGFLRRHGVDFGSPQGWSRFLGLCGREPDGRRVLDAYLEQKRIARTSRAKFRMLWELLRRHPGERTLVFTADNNTAYRIGASFLLPVLTHHTRIAERRAFLDAFRAGQYPVLITSRVLNEGVDVPEASVGIVVSGSGSVREHVQRLGRILRPARGKQAILYELVSAGTSEFSISHRRRQHRAYQRPHPLPL
ncbi:MAG: ATP-dependent helicase, partial [Lentisphaeria bacterium]|nr:ATP-dependent helicase [Lentisphaeria bacterium]